MQLHVGREIRLKYRVGAVDEIDVLHAVFLRQRIHLFARQLIGAEGEAIDVVRDLRQHLGHVVLDPAVLAAQHHLEDGEALAEARLEVADLLGLIGRDQVVHPPGDHERRAEGHAEDDREQEETGLALQRQAPVGGSPIIPESIGMRRQIGPFRPLPQGAMPAV